MKNLMKISFMMLIASMILFSCKKEDYIDTGIHDPKFNGTTWQYLESRPELFDTLMVALKIAKLDDVIKNEEVTFFAPPDKSILKSVWKLNESLFRMGQDTITTLDQVRPEVWRKFLSKYIIKGKYLAKDFNQMDTLNLAAFPGGVYKNYEGTDMNIGVLYNDIKTSSNTGTQIIKYAGYRQLYLNFPYSVAVPDEEQDYFIPFLTAPVATSDIQPTNGVLHVLQFSKHAFGFQTNLFVNEAWTVGILYK
ncbi:fasciclin domain-containing protein [Sphingobacterium sp. SRCM116780]|uniref:fasciclin domain-containing protein n=1 Tax=Sphingobacterium sp. SRCM116780 TaxID=2907623 RepID=UPI001F45665B|nr:fasciclin domain-containing protein [Sphingobacterium sp. SRCM116780]UIR55383.1 fasciclin domain-containing protein [Sphingobacterium sp. SRCM116780]